MLQQEKKDGLQHLLIIEPHFDGHRGVYVNWIARAAIERGYHVTVATLSSTTSHPLWAPLNELPGGKFKSVLVETELMGNSGTGGVVGLIANEFRSRCLFEKLYREGSKVFSADMVIVPYLDYCANAIALLGSPFGKTPWTGIVMRQSFHFTHMGVKAARPALAWIKEKLFIRLLHSERLKAVLSIDETLVQFLFSNSGQGSKKLMYLPDPATGETTGDKAKARLLFGIDVSAVVILVFGGVNERKGVYQLLRAIESVEVSANVEILLVGRQSTGIRDFLGSPKMEALKQNGRIHELDRFVDDSEANAAFHAADIVWLGYRNFDLMSGVLVLAGQLGLPVIGTSQGLVGHITRNHGLGLAVEIGNLREVREAINKLVTNEELRLEMGLKGRVKFSPHTVRNFTDTIMDAF